MKKTILLIFGISILLVQSGLAQSSKKIPASVKATFEGKYPGVKVSEWESEPGGYEAEFKMNGKKMEALFDASGAWVNTRTYVKIEEFPPAVFTAMTTGDYRDWTFHDYAIVDTPGGKRYNIIAKYSEQEHDLMYNDAGMLVEKIDKTKK